MFLYCILPFLYRTYPIQQGRTSHSCPVSDIHTQCTRLEVWLQKGITYRSFCSLLLKYMTKPLNPPPDKHTISYTTIHLRGCALQFSMNLQVYHIQEVVLKVLIEFQSFYGKNLRSLPKEAYLQQRPDRSYRHIHIYVRSHQLPPLSPRASYTFHTCPCNLKTKKYFY